MAFPWANDAMRTDELAVVAEQSRRVARMTADEARIQRCRPTHNGKFRASNALQQHSSAAAMEPVRTPTAEDARAQLEALEVVRSLAEGEVAAEGCGGLCNASALTTDARGNHLKGRKRTRMRSSAKKPTG